MIRGTRLRTPWARIVLLLVTATAASCGDDSEGPAVDGVDAGTAGDGGPIDPCAALDCTSPPPPLCVGEATLRTFAGTGHCEAGSCVYDSYADSPCTDCCYGAEINLTGDPLGGGAHYSKILSPSEATVVVSTAAELLAALGSATAGQIIYVADSADIDLSGNKEIAIPAKVTIASGRGRDGSPGGLLHCDTFAYPLFVAKGEGVRLTGLRMRGPNPDIGDHDYDVVVHSGAISNRHLGFEVDNCELWAWGTNAVSLGQGASDARVHHNYIHHTRRAGYGYGVVLDRANAIIEGNVFDACRHQIAATGRPGTSYEARYNLVLEHANGHDFDMHGAADYDKNDTKAVWRFDEGTGTTAKDSSTSGYHPVNNCTLTNMDAATCWVQGKVNTALQLDGADDRLECSTDPSLTSAQGTYTLWIRPTASAAATLLSLTAEGSNSSVLGLDASGHVKVDITAGGSVAEALVTDAVVGSGDWHHIAVTQDGTAIAVYIDGKVTTTTGTNGGKWTESFALTSVWIGNGPGGAFSGAIDEVRIYDRALEAVEVTRHAAGNPDVAGDRILIHHNTFRNLEQSGIVIRGVPAEEAKIHHNWFYRTDPGGAIRQTNASGNLVAENNYFGGKPPLGTLLPVAAAQAQPAFGKAPLATQLTAGGSYSRVGHIDAWRWDFGDGQQGDGVTANHTYDSAGAYLSRATVRDERGALASAFVPVSVSPTTSDYRLDFWVKDSYSGPLSGFYQKQALVNDKVVWSEDVQGAKGWAHVSIDLNAQAEGQESLEVAFRVQNLTAVNGELIELDVFWDDVKLFGSALDREDFESGGGWTYEDDGSPFTGRPSSMDPHSGNWAYWINSPYSTACPAGAWAEIHQKVPLLPKWLLGHWALDDAAGAAAKDSSLYENHGALTGVDSAVAWVPGVIGGALTLDGVNDEVTIGPAGSLASAVGTLSLWLKQSSSGAPQTLWEVRDSGSQNAFSLGLNAEGKVTVRALRAGAAAIDLAATTPLSGTDFHHLAVTQDGTSLQVYVDGAVVGTTGTQGTLLTGHLTPASASIGAGSGGRFAGTIDEVRLIGKALAAAEIAEEHQRGRVLASWSLEDGSGTAAKDSSGQGHDCTLKGFESASPWATGKSGGAVELDGDEDYLDCAGAGTLATAKGTIELWFKADTQNDNRDLVNLWEDGYQNFLLLRRTEAGRILLLIEDDDAAIASVTSTTAVGEGWHHVAVTQDGSGIAIFVDGQKQIASGTNSSAWTGHLALKGVWLGGGHWSYLDGAIDEVKLWARALTATEIARHAAGE